MSGNEQKPVLVTGATGRQGGAVLRHLRERGWPVRALTRRPDSAAAQALAADGAEIVAGDMEDWLREEGWAGRRVVTVERDKIGRPLPGASPPAAGHPGE